MAQDFIEELEDKLKLSEISFHLVVEYWREYIPSRNFEWKVEVFDESKKDLIPEDKGLYAFVVAPKVANIPEVGYLFYVGQAGQDSSSHLNKRFKEYLYEQKMRKRPHIHRFLNQYKGFILFIYSSITDGSDLRELETELLNALQPILNRKDFEASFGVAQRGIF